MPTPRKKAAAALIREAEKRRLAAEAPNLRTEATTSSSAGQPHAAHAVFPMDFIPNSNIQSETQSASIPWEPLQNLSAPPRLSQNSMNLLALKAAQTKQ